MFGVAWYVCVCWQVFHHFTQGLFLFLAREPNRSVIPQILVGSLDNPVFWLADHPESPQVRLSKRRFQACQLSEGTLSFFFAGKPKGDQPPRAQRNKALVFPLMVSLSLRAACGAGLACSRGPKPSRCSEIGATLHKRNGEQGPRARKT